MNPDLRSKLITIAESKIDNSDPAHDISHVHRVLTNAERIAEIENADMDIIIPAALFHDVVNYPKNDPRSKYASDESAALTKELLSAIPEYPQDKIDKVYSAIQTCSFSKGIIPEFLEAKIIQDADGLEATGAISIMRTFCSTGSMKRPFYNIEDPFSANREPDSLKYALDLFFTRLLVVQNRMHTETAKTIAQRRTKFLKDFLEEFKLELVGQ